MDQERRELVAVRLSPALKRKLDEYSEAKGQTFSETVRAALRSGLEVLKLHDAAASVTGAPLETMIRR